MIRRAATVVLTCAAVFAGAEIEYTLGAKNRDLALESLLSFPFPNELAVSPAGSTVAWTFDERGVRNIYAADGPDFKVRCVTSYTSDDGQELTNLSFSDDGKTIVYVRGGDHGSN